MNPSPPGVLKNAPWFEHYDAGVPHTLHPYPATTLFDIVHQTALEKPDHPAMLFKSRPMSYGMLDRLSDAFAAALVELGVKKGDVVALLLPNCPQFLIAEFGAHKAGAIIAPINPLYSTRELEHAFGECGAEWAVVMTRFYPKIKNLQPHTRLRGLIATNIKEYLSPLLRALYTLAKEKKEGDRIHLAAGDHWLGDLLAGQKNSPRPAVEISPSDPAILLFSGGTTGLPKCAIGLHQGLVASGLQIFTWFKEILFPWQDGIMVNLPLFHAYAQAGILPVGIVAHCPLSLVPNPRDLDDLLTTIHHDRPAFLPGVPTLFNAITAHPKVTNAQVSLRSLKLCICGAAPLHAETKRRFEALSGGKIVEGFAMTETMMAAIVNPVHGAHKIGSIGMPLPDVQARIVDSEDGGRELSPGEIGELTVKAPNVMASYWRQPAETANTLRDGWIYSGDLAYMDEDGYFFIVDRKKDVIKASGFQVWPREVEEVLAAHPAVQEVGVAGIPDQVQGEAVKAWIVLRPGQAASEAELRSYCKEQLAGYKVPHYFEFRAELPKSMVGKVLRRELVSGEIAGG